MGYPKWYALIVEWSFRENLISTAGGLGYMYAASTRPGPGPKDKLKG